MKQHGKKVMKQHVSKDKLLSNRGFLKDIMTDAGMNTSDVNNVIGRLKKKNSNEKKQGERKEVRFQNKVIFSQEPCSRRDNDQTYFDLVIPQKEYYKQNSYDESYEEEVIQWRYPKGRTRTVSAVLIVCLNLGVDPPDVVRPNPCARVECWVNPERSTPKKSFKINWN